MNNFLVKIGILAVIVIALIMVVKVFTPSQDRRVTRETTVSQAEEDTVEAEPAKPQKKQKPQKALQVEEKIEVVVGEPQVEVVEQEFRQLSEEDSIMAQHLFTQMETQLKTGRRLKGAGLKNAVEKCRQIIKKYPGTQFDYRARQALATIPKRWWRRYDITLEEATPENCFKSQQ